MKKIKILSSITLASVIMAGIIGTSKAAENTKTMGEFNPGLLVEGKTVVPYVLTDAKDTLTVSEILSLGKYTSIKLNGKEAKTETEVHTGDYITTGNSQEEKHIVIYGDVNGKSGVNVDDVTLVARIAVENEKNVSNIQKEAADVVDDEKINVEDVTKLARFAVGNEKVIFSSMSSDEEEIFKLINEQRTSNGLKPLQIDEQVQKAAKLKAQDMVNKNYFDHQSPTYGSPFDMLDKFKIRFYAAGENIAGNPTNAGAVRSWMNSPGHKANILESSFNYTGIGVVKGSMYGKIYAQIFIGK